MNCNQLENIDSEYTLVSLSELEQYNYLSIRAIEICKINNLNSLNEITEYYGRNLSFKKLSKCVYKIEKELSEFCKRFKGLNALEILDKLKEREIVKTKVHQLSENDIKAADRHIEYLTSKLSVRARNGLKSIMATPPNLKELTKTIYTPNFTFSSIRNIGDKTVTELTSFVASILDYLNKIATTEASFATTLDSIPATQSVNGAIQDEINRLTPFKKSVLGRQIEHLMSRLNIRARNGLTQFFGGMPTITEVANIIFSPSFDFNVIKNIGVKSATELNEFKACISDFVLKLAIINEKDLSREYSKSIINSTFGNLSSSFTKNLEDVFNDSGQLKLFELINLLITDGKILKSNRVQLFQYLYSDSYAVSLEKIAANLNIGKERVRQLKVDLENNLHEYFQFLKYFSLHDFVDYGLSIDANLIIVDKAYSANINQDERAQFNIPFYKAIIGLLLEESHVVLGNELGSNLAGYANEFKYRFGYVIKKPLYKAFDFNSFISSISANISTRITESYSLHFEGYLSQFLTDRGKDFILPVKEVCETILFYEFDLVVDSDGLLLFERNVKRTLPESVVEVLSELGKMTKVDDILIAFKNKFPDIEANESSIRATLNREKELFIYIGRTSTYGLRRWESENEFLKGGTIRNLAEEYLEKSERPQHIYNIVKYVQQYRDTSSKSIFSNMQAEENNRFLFLEGGYVGLKRKYYSKSDITFKKVAGTHFRTEILRKFNKWDYEKMIAYYVKKYDYERIQVVNVLEGKLRLGEIILNNDNTIEIYDKD